VQVDQPVFDADPVQRLRGVAPVFGADPGLVVLDVVAVQIGAGGDVGIALAHPGSELAEVVFDVLDRRGRQAQIDLGDVAVRSLGEPCGTAVQPVTDTEGLPGGRRWLARLPAWNKVSCSRWKMDARLRPEFGIPRAP